MVIIVNNIVYWKFLKRIGLKCSQWDCGDGGITINLLDAPSRTNTQKRCPFHHMDWNAKVGSQETPGVTGKFGLGIRNEAGQRLIS